jgi:hypothetical protein
MIIPSMLPSGLLKSFTEGMQGLVATLLSKHMPGGDDHRDGPLNDLESGEGCDARDVGQLLSCPQINPPEAREGDRQGALLGGSMRGVSPCWPVRFVSLDRFVPPGARWLHRLLRACGMFCFVS